MAEIPVHAAPMAEDEYDGLHPDAPSEPDLSLAQIAVLMQEGRWEEAASALKAIEPRLQGSRQLEDMREALSLHLSAEESWQAGAPTVPDFVEARSVRLLLMANVFLYLLVAALWLLAGHGASH